MSTRITRFLSWTTLTAFFPFAVVNGIPARASAATNPIVSLTITQTVDGEERTASFTGAEGEEGQIVLEGPGGLRIVIAESDLETVTTAEVKDESGEVVEDTYTLVPKEGEDVTPSTLRVVAGGASGPAEGQITYSGTAEDTETGRELEYKAVVSDIGTRALPAAAVVVIVVVSVGAALCLGVIGIQAATNDCAHDCTTKCAGGAGVAECKTDIVAGVDYSKDKGVRVGCSAKCEAKCESPAVSRAPSPLGPGAGADAARIAMPALSCT